METIRSEVSDMSDENKRDDDDPAATPGGLKPEKVEDRPNVGTVKPEDYPEREREESSPRR